ncbi:hypothetical protein AB0L65_40065 [Nonomuraea sp. NPDC052116]|uniref:hypothetical protein n=1 Tax=Nonomuraea sp. NPDC052116 TaxID=3155665 RepID=UPI0034389D70
MDLQIRTNQRATGAAPGGRAVHSAADEHNLAAPGTSLEVPVYVQRQPNVTYGDLTSL